MTAASGNNLRFACVARTHVGCRRKINEDAMLSRADLGLWAVADGMGGHDAGEVASALVVDMLQQGPAETELGARVTAMRAALHNANDRLVSMARDGGGQRTIGSTVVVMAADGTSFTCLWAGDSRAYLARDGVLEQLTRDHSLVQQLVETGDIDAAQAHQHPNANIILRAVGASPELELDDVGGDVRAGDVFLLASDGLTRLFDEAELLAELSAPDLDAAADRMVQTSLSRKAPDNVTFVIVRVEAGS